MATQSRLYALHTYYTASNGRKKYYRLSTGAYTKARAVVLYQNALLSAAFTGVPIALKTVKEQYDYTAPGPLLGQMAEAVYTSGVRNV